MKIINNITQGSEEWLKLRLGVATASNFHRIVTNTGALSKSLNNYALHLASQILTVRQEEPYTNEAMQRGNELEPEARRAYEEYSLSPVTQVAFMSCGDYGYSPDGLVGDDGLIEIKCPNQVTHTEYLSRDQVPSRYKAQVQGGMFVSGRKWCDFISFNPNFVESKTLFVKRVYRDEEFIEDLSHAIEEVINLRDTILSKIRK